MHSQWADYINQKVEGAATVNEAEIGDSSITINSEKLFKFVNTL